MSHYDSAMSLRAFLVAIGALLVVLGGVGLVLHQLNVFQTCTASREFYGPAEVCTQSPATLIVSIVLVVLGLVVALGGIVVDSAK